MNELIGLDEVFALAIQIESNGAAFYRAAADRQLEDANKQMLAQLAEVEDGHKAIFEAMRHGAAMRGIGTAPADARPDSGLYMAAIADGYRVEGSPRVAEELTGNETMAQILRIAIDLEKESVLFYLGLRDVVNDDAARVEIERIINEEKAHITTLSQELRKL